MYYIMLKFPFLYVGLGRTIKDFLKLVGEKKIDREKLGNFKSLGQSTPFVHLRFAGLRTCSINNMYNDFKLIS